MTTLVAVLFVLIVSAQAQTPQAAQSDIKQSSAAVVKQYCATCHNAAIHTAGVVLDPAELSQGSAALGRNAELWERAVKQLHAKTMPPVGMPRPDAATYTKLTSYIESSLDGYATANPNAGTLPNLHRLTRTEYKNAIRDLLALENLPKEMDFTLLLPADNVSSGFDNVADLLYVSPAVMERYLDAAGKIARLAIGDPSMPLMVNVHQLPLDGPQGVRVEDLPFGTRGGIAVKSYFPLDAEYEIQIELSTGGGGGGFGGPREAHQLEITVDGERKQLVTIGGPGGPGGGRRGGGGPTLFRIPVKAGPHQIGVTFIQRTEALDEATLRPRDRSRGTLPAVSAVTIRGPYKQSGPGDTPSRQRIFTCRPQSAAEESACAKQILARLTRLAYRRPITDSDLKEILSFYEDGRKQRDFDLGIQTALERLLVSPQFLYRIEKDPEGVKAGTSYRLSDLDLASRLSFFLWSSIPDDELLTVAASGKLKDPGVYEKQVRRMLADPRSETMVTNFASQWLYLNDVQLKEPDLFLFRDFDDSLRQSFIKETELFLDSVLREDRSVLDLLTANYTFVNERLAKHYGIPNIRGPQFQRVTFPPDSPRGGLLGQGSILLLTSYSTRTSPVLRGKYVLENLLASPPPPPPPNVPSLSTEGSKSEEQLSLRDAMIRHRANPACANCHARMDPIGFAMENFDAIGQYRDNDAGKPIDVSSKLTDGTVVDGLAGVKAMLLKDPDRFAGAVAEKLLMYGIGRNVQYFDRPALRRIIADAAKDKYKFATLVLGVTQSVPFQTRQSAILTASSERKNP